jgi:4-hydroxybenzoate polyprenyltransferase
MGITFSFFTGKFWNIGIAILNSFLLFFYARMFKMKLLSGNLIVSYTAASTFVYGGITNENIKPSLLIAVFAFLYTFIREIVKDMEDKAADEFYKATTLPVRIGFDKTIAILFFPALALFLYSVWIYSLDKITFTTLLLLLLIINIPLIGMILYLKKKPLESAFKRVSTYMKLDMLALLLILAIG